MSTVIVPARIGPKVFADVPSAQELADAQRAVDNMRRGRNAATLWMILLAGALVAAGVFIFLLMGRPAPKTDPANDPAVLNVQPKRLKIEKLSRATTLSELQRSSPSAISLAELSLINRVDSTATLPAGRMVKRVVTP